MMDSGQALSELISVNWIGGAGSSRPGTKARKASKYSE